MAPRKKSPSKRERDPAEIMPTTEEMIYHLGRLIVLVAGDEPIDRGRRDAIAQALDLLRVTLAKNAKPPGRRIAESTWLQAAIVNALVATRGAELKDALATVAGDKEKDYQRVEGALHKMKRGQAPIGVHLTDSVIDSFASRLSRRDRNK